MASDRIFERLSIFTDHMEPEALLDEVFQALSDMEADSVLDHIGRMWDIPEDEESDDEVEEEDEEPEEDE
jgi:hypothetical protein